MDNSEKDAQNSIDFEARLKELETQLLDEITASKAKSSPIQSVQRLPEIDPNTATLGDVSAKCKQLDN